MNKIIDFDINEEPLQTNNVSQIEELCKYNNVLNIEDIHTLLKYVSYSVRRKIADYEGKSMSEYSYSNKCDLSQSMIYYYLQNLGIKVNPVNINEVIYGVCGHSFVIAHFNTVDEEKIFLLDPTYLQFFSKENCDSNKFIIINNSICVAPDPGFFVVADHNESVILPLLQNGYTELTEEVAKVYGDSFFQTKQGTMLSQINNNRANGLNYIKWFIHYTSPLSKSVEELREMDLLIDSSDTVKKTRSV